ncbi:F-box domain-containing protein [Heracleum sosnowskyi]|uniref:F-box domain-containing protein n=1 Tax=Heracleum sosnowskyi TaxID=360622 RepID=A0AAD8HJ06_9APIA|nr:F-box domain-containing protein [Heracleum sosnowskyi]
MVEFPVGGRKMSGALRDEAVNSGTRGGASRSNGWSYSFVYQESPGKCEYLSLFNCNGLQSRMMNATVHLAEDLLAEILVRLPVKDLLRSRCVSKPWCSLIDSPRFVRAHLKRSIECKTNKGVIFRGFHAYSVDFDSLDDTTAVKIDEPLTTLLCGTGVVGSCNGLLCLYQKKTDIFLWNPGTRKCRVLPTAPTDFVRPYDIDPTFIRGFGYDAVNDDYKVLRILNPYGRDNLTGSKVVVYSLKTNSWRRLQSISNHFRLSPSCGMFVGGALHWITIKTLGLESCLSILAFDLAIENHREVPMPNVRNKNPNEWSLCIFAESLCVLIHDPFVSIDVWLMNEYGDGNSWCKLFSLEHRQFVRFKYVRPVAYSKSRRDVLVEVGDEKVMWYTFSCDKVMWYNLERKNIRAVKIANMPDVFHDLEVYTESLVPLDYTFSCDGKQPQEKQKQQKRNERDRFLSKGFKLVL